MAADPHPLPSTAAVLDGIVRSRRSVRKFTARRVPEEAILHALELAILAPTSSNLQQWEFWWVREDALRQKLADACFGQQAARTASDLIVVAGRTRTWRGHAGRILAEWPGEPPRIVRQYYRWLAPLLYTQGPLGLLGLLKRVLFGVLGLFRPVPRWPHSRGHMREWATKSAALAAENLMLALRAHGYDTCPMEGHDERRVKKLLRIPRDAVVVMIVAVGEAAEGGVYNERMRVPLGELLHRS